MNKSLKDWSRENGELRSDQVSAPNNAEIQTGCLQRIADATETIAQNYNQLVQERDRYYKWYREEKEKREALERSIRAHKANYTRLKAKCKSNNIS